MKRPAAKRPPTPVYDERRPKKSRAVPIGLVAFVASSLVACGPTDYKRCVDDTGRVVDDERCTRPAAPGPPIGVYHWYYGGRGLRVGDMVSGGSSTPSAGVRYHSSTVRGGFGRSAATHASGGHA